MSSEPECLAPPPRRWLWRESRVMLDLARMLVPLARSRLGPRRERDAAPVIVVPGFGADDRSTLPLRQFLRGSGFRAEGWGLGRNRAGVDLPHTLADLSDRWQVASRPDYRGEASVPYLCDRLTERVERRHAELGRPVAMIGWSLGGYLAREVARDLPHIVEQVVTLGSPTVGGPKYTAAAGYFRSRGMDLDWIETEIGRREERPIRQPVTAIVSRTDAVVSFPAAIDRHSENVRHIEVDAAHFGLGFNPTVWRHIVAALEASASSGGSLRGSDSRAA